MQRYLLFQHDPRHRTPLLDEAGRMMFREGLLQDGINCDPFTFNTECTEWNLSLQKNQTRSEVKAHHYIISFDPRDVSENGLTAQKVQALGLEFAKKYFAGHQVLAVTHTDGHHRSGNLHCHITFNSLRKYAVPRQDFMERPIDAMAGYKHHLTMALLKHMQQTLNEICTRERLHTVNFSTPAERRIPDAEFWIGQRKQDQLDQVNEPILADGLHPRTQTFKTIKRQLREAIDSAVEKSRSEQELIEQLKEEHNIAVKESRGQYGFLHPEYSRTLRGRSLGSAYEREALIRRMTEPLEKAEANRPEYASLPRVFLMRSDLRLVVDLQNCVKAQQSRAYARKVVISNLQQMARTVACIQEQGINTFEQLQSVQAEVERRYQEAARALGEVEKQMKGINSQIHFTGQYLSGKRSYTMFLNADDKAAYRSAHREEIASYEEAVRQLKAFYADGKFPSMKELKAAKAELQPALAKAKNETLSLARQRKEMRILRKNVDAILSKRDAVRHMRE